MTLADLIPRRLATLVPYTLLRKLREYSRRLWVRVLIMGMLAFVALGLTHMIELVIPKELGSRLGGQAADRLLNIIANAMLAVTTFSLSVMVTVYRSISDQWTPRVHRLIVQDRTTQTTLAVFIGAYVYALVAIILRELGIYTDDRALVLFWMTVLVLTVIVYNLIRWVLHLQGFGSLIDSTRQIEEATRRQLRDRLATPCLGAHPLTTAVPKGARAICAAQSGYMQQIYPEALQNTAELHGVDLYLTRNIGSFVFLNEPMVMAVTTGAAESKEHDWDSLQDAVRRQVVLGDVRSYEQDPRFGLVAMGEVGSKALSPGVNDPGTAIDVITRIGRILSDYKDENALGTKVRLTRLHVQPLNPHDLIEDGLVALSRDGAGVVEVQQRLQHTFGGLMRHPDPGLSAAAHNAAVTELRRALAALDFPPDRIRLWESARQDVRAAVADTDGAPV